MSVQSVLNRQHNRQLFLMRNEKRLQKQNEMKNLKKKVNRIARGIELKYRPFQSAGAAVNSGFNITLLNGVTQGDDSADREGNDIYMKKLVMNLSFIVGDTTNTIRCCIIYDRQTNGVTPVSTDTFQSFVTVNATAPLNDVRADDRRRFSFLYDRIIDLSTAGPACKTLRIRKRLNHHTNYSGAGSTDAVIYKGGLYLVLISDSTAASHPSVSYAGTLYYTG